MSDVVRSIPRGFSPDSQGKETANQKWRRTALQRIQRVLKGLDALGKLGNRRNAYSEDEAKKIIATLRARVDEIEAALIPKAQSTFSFDE